MAYSFWNNSGTELNKIKFKQNDNWAEIAKKTNNAKFNSLWTLVDNGDGVVQKDEIKMLNKLLKVADQSVDNTKGNKQIENEELIALSKKIKDGTIKDEVDAKTAERLNSNLAKTSWSEGVDRNISKINISTINVNNAQGRQFPVIKAELEAIGKEVGFEVNDLKLLSSGGIWIEDYGVRRADDKMLVISEYAAGGVDASRRDREHIIQNRKHISTVGQGSATRYFDLMEAKFQQEDLVRSKSYLEGGNVLNTRLSDGTPAAVVGQESIGYTLQAMDLANNEENVEIAKLLQETPIEGMTEQNKQELITQLTEMRDKTADIRRQAEEKLTEGGYEIVKIPCFATGSNSTINYMNGIGGTSKTGESFYITNKSEYPELNEAMKKYFKNAGIDKMYFVSTGPFLTAQGGIDCLTQEE